MLIGFGGHAKSVIDAIEKQNDYQIAGMLEMAGKEKMEYRGYRVIGGDDSLRELFEKGIRNAFVTLGFMGNSHARNHIYKKLKEIGFTIPVIKDPSAVFADDVDIGEGTFVGKRAVINSASTIGKMCIINTGAIVEHDAEVGDFSHISVGAILCGQAQVGENAFIGAAAAVIQGIHIGNGSIVGAGTILVKDVGNNMLAYSKERRPLTEVE